MAQEAFELAEQFQTPVFVMMDLDLGMNNWMSDGFKYPDKPINRGKLLTAAKLKEIGEWGRYKDVDGDGIAYRTIPGDGLPVYFTRGSGHNAKGQYSERPDDYVENMDRLSRKFETARQFVPKPVVQNNPKAKIGFIGYGTSHLAIEESRDQLREETKVETSYFRLRAYPFNDELAAFIDAHERVYVIEQNRDAQLLQLMKLEVTPDRQKKLRSVLHYNGLPIDARSITDDVLAQEGFEVATKTADAASSGGHGRWGITSMATPIKVNRIGLEPQIYKGGKTTLCAGCGHNAISERIIDAFYEMGIDPKQVIKLSGIGCSSKSPAYFLGGSHGFNAVHGRMPSVGTGAMLANHKLIAIGISGDGDTGAIGIGQFVHLMRRNLPIIYIIEDNGCYGLTKGQFSPTADLGSKLKTGVVNDLPPIDTCALAVELGATFVARSFSGDKKQLLALLKAALAHRGTVMLDVISPCVTFNDHEGSTKSYAYVKDHDDPVEEVSFVPFFEDIAVDYEPGTTQEVTMHDGSKLYLKKLEEDYDPTDKIGALKRLHETARRGEFATGIIYIEPDRDDFLTQLNVVDEPLATLPLDRVRPGPEALEEIMEGLR